jgi:EpsI family protein
MTSARPYVAALALLGGIFATHNLRPKEATELRGSLREFPSTIGFWHSRDLPFDDEVVHATGADDYINRVYLGATPPIELYVGYYKTQGFGDKIHSPKNCLPGDGWEPVRSDRVQIGSAGSRPVLVSEYLVERGTHQDLVLYWYQAHGRVVAGEYGLLFWLVADALKRRGTDGALIRIWTTASDGELSARRRAVEFAHQVYPQLEYLLPN